MNPVLEAIKNRKSVRAYESTPIPRELVEKIIEAANQAPYTSMTRSQPWRFVIVEDKEFKQKLLQTALPFWKQMIEPMKDKMPELYKAATCIRDAMDEPQDVIYYNAPTILFVVGPADNPFSSVLACENAMIAAQSLGLGSCYVGFGGMVKGNPEIASALELKDNEAIYGPILLGYPKKDPAPKLAEALDSIQPIKKTPVAKWI